MCECLKFEPKTLKKKLKIFAPNIVIKSTLFPKKKRNDEIVIAWTIELLKEKTMRCNGCTRKTVRGVSFVAE